MNEDKPVQQPHRRPKSDDRIKIVCVLKKGSVYNEKYLKNLFNGLQRTIGHRDDWNLVCFTDLTGMSLPPEIELIPLEVGLPGWWSKLEAFRYLGTCMYMDLDIVVIKDFSTVFDDIRNLQECEIMLMEDFNPDYGFTTSLMAWNGDWSQLLLEITQADIDHYKWDQFYTVKKLQLLEAGIESFNNHLKGILSYKYHIMGPGLPSNAVLVDFHGKPKPHETAWLGWVQRTWGE